MTTASVAERADDGGAAIAGRAGAGLRVDRLPVVGEVPIMETHLPDDLKGFRETFDDLKFDDVVKF